MIYNNVDKHINFLIDKYNLYKYYNKFIFISIITSLFREMFYWLIIIFSNYIEQYPDLIYIFGYILLFIIFINIPLDRYFHYTKTILIEKIKIANNTFFYNRIIKIKKTKILNFDLVEFNNTIDYFNDNIEQYIYNIKVQYEIPLRIISLLVIAFNKEIKLLITLFIIYAILIIILNELKFINEKEKVKKLFKYDSIIRNYIINSKTFLVNNEININYLINNVNNLQNINTSILELTNILDMKMNTIIVIYILILLVYNIKNFSPKTFYYYFIIVYDIEFIGDKIIEYYRNKSIITKMNTRLEYLYSFEIQDKIINSLYINKIIIKRIINKEPYINIKNIIIEKNDHILIDGISGSGKSSLLYVLKGLIEPIKIDIQPNIEYINNESYLTLANHKSLFNGNLYDIITNYDNNPNINLINKCLDLSKFINTKENNYINIEKISSGERIRLLVARIIYNVLKYNYNILLFDEIDENLNDSLAIEICTNIKKIFSNKIILYITHNERVKQLFNKKILIYKGINK